MIDVRCMCLSERGVRKRLCVFMCQREGALGDDDSADMDGENGRGFEEYEWAGQKRIRATALLEGGFRGKNTRTHFVLYNTGFISHRFLTEPDPELPVCRRGQPRPPVSRSFPSLPSVCLLRCSSAHPSLPLFLSSVSSFSSLRPVSNVTREL